VSSTPGIDAAIERSELVRRAFETARQAHAGQTRDGSGGMPYIQHPLAVAERLATHSFRDEVLAAALLHDVVEKSEKDAGEIRQGFGDRVGDLVEAMTEDEAIEDYEERKEEHRWRIAEAGQDALAVFAADKLINVGMLRDSYAACGEAVSEQLKVPLDRKISVWEADLDMLFDEAPDLPLVQELADEMVGLWGDRFRDAQASSG
jgi:guanosine-3',5'-bis(diphosphate) 3'-pyrophosphohydrolase